MTHVFVSYSHKDGEFVGELQNQLTKAGIGIKIDSQFLEPGKNWHEKIDSEIQQAFAVVVVLSPDAFESKYVTYEWAYALGLGIAIVPLMLIKTELHPRLEPLQYIEFTKHFNLQPSWDKLIHTLKDLEKPPREIAAPNSEIMTLLDNARGEYLNGNLEGTLEIYEQALSRASDQVKPQVCVQMAYVLCKPKEPDLDRADELLQEALALRADFPQALATRGLVQSLMARKAPDVREANRLRIKAVGALEEALNAEPYMRDMDNESWWGTLGGVHKRADNLPEAIRAYDQAVKVTPQSSYPRSNLALLYMMSNQPDLMKRTYRVVERLARTKVQQNFSDYWTHTDLLVADLAQGKYDGAEADEQDFFDIIPGEVAQTVVGGYIDTMQRLAAVLTPDEATHIQPFIEHAQDFLKTVKSA